MAFGIFFLNKFIYLFAYFRLHWVFVATCGLSLVAASGGYSLLWCAGFSLQWLLLLRSMGSRCTGFSSCGTRALERRLSSCGARAWLFRGMWDPPGPGLEPVSPALAGGFLTIAPPGRSLAFGISTCPLAGQSQSWKLSPPGAPLGLWSIAGELGWPWQDTEPGGRTQPPGLRAPD